MLKGSDEVFVKVAARERPDQRTSGVLAAALGATLLFLSLVVPVVGALGAMVSPFPLIVQRLRRGLGSALLAVLLAVGAVGALFTPGLALGFLMFLVVPGLLIGETMARGRGLVRGCAWAFAFLAAEIGAALLLAGGEISAAVLGFAAQLSSPQFLQELRSSGLSPEKAEQLTDGFATVERVFQVVYPALFLILGAVVVLANASLLRGYLARRDPGWLEGGEFEGIRWPLGLSVAFVLAGLAVLVPPLRPAAYNVLLVVGFFYVLQGLAVVAYYARRLAGPWLLRAGLVALVLLNPWAPQILGLVGLFDTWFEFRRWADPPEAEQG